MADSSGSIRHLDTSSFDTTIEAYRKYIRQYEDIVEGVNVTTNQLMNNWKGKGKNAFEKSCKQIQLNLIDIRDIMYGMQDALINAKKAYQKTDAYIDENMGGSGGGRF